VTIDDTVKALILRRVVQTAWNFVRKIKSPRDLSPLFPQLIQKRRRVPAPARLVL
jgi:hypothetical protein